MIHWLLCLIGVHRWVKSYRFEVHSVGGCPDHCFLFEATLCGDCRKIKTDARRNDIDLVKHW